MPDKYTDYAGDASKVLNLVGGIVASCATGNPLPAIAAFVPVVTRATDVWLQQNKRTIIANRAGEISRSPQGRRRINSS